MNVSQFINTSNRRAFRVHIKRSYFIGVSLTTKEIAAKDFLSVYTVNIHLKNILKKPGINNTSELIMYAVKTGIVDTTKYYI